MRYLVDGVELFHCGHTPTHLLFTKDEGGHNKMVEIPFSFEGIICPKFIPISKNMDEFKPLIRALAER
jgi:hypothetical protein